MGRAIVVLLLLLILLSGATGCGLFPQGDGGGGDPPPAEPGGAEALPSDSAGPSGLEFFGTKGAALMEDVLVFLGGGRRPARSLVRIRDVHNMKDWSHRFDVPDAVTRCRDAVQDLARSDYETWDETALVVSVLSTMATRDEAGLVRAQCVSALEWLRSWVHPDLVGIGPGVDTTDEAVIRALRALDEFHKEAGPHSNVSGKFACIDAISVLGSHPWGQIDRPQPSAIRARLSRPRGVIRRLTARDLLPCRADPEIRDTLDRALLRVTDEVAYLTELAALGDRTPHVRATAARALLLAGERSAVQTLAIAVIREEDPATELELLGTLGALAAGEPSARRHAVPAIASALSSPNVSIRRTAARELERVTGERPGPAPADWQRWWQTHRREYEDR